MNTSTTERPSTSDEILNCNFADHSTKHSFRLLNQNVKVCNLDIPNERFSVYTELHLLPMEEKTKEIHISMGQCKILFFVSSPYFCLFSVCYLPGEDLGPKDMKITVEGYPAEFCRNNLRLKEISRNEDKNLRNLKTNIKKAYNKYKGGLTIKIPKECETLVRENRVMVVRICINVVKPKYVGPFEVFPVLSDRLGYQI